jgi:hypothetical protein
MRTHAFIVGPVPGLCAKGYRYDKPCGLPRSAEVHRAYLCRVPSDADGVISCALRFYSIETRDRHEANVHGDGW